MKLFILCLLPLSLAIVPSENNKGWANYLDDEVSEFHDLPLTWSLNTTVPDWLRGSYVKNGPGRKSFDAHRYYGNYLDSWGKLNKFTFNGADVKFSGRMIETENYLKNANSDKMVPSITLGPVEPNDWKLSEMFAMASNGYDNTNVMLWRLGGEDKNNAQYIATTDFPAVHEIDIDTLAVVKKHELNSFKDGISESSCAHWRREVDSTTSLQFHQIIHPITRKLEFQLFRFGNNFDEREVVGSFEMPHGSMIHMFSNTKNYAVIALYPVMIDIMKMPTVNMHPLEALVHLEGEPTKFYLINLKTGEVLDDFSTFAPELTWSTHHINAWEEEDEVVFDVSCNPWDALASFMNLDEMLEHVDTNEDFAGTPVRRVRLNLSTKEVNVEEWPNELGIPMLNTVDFPAINSEFTGIKNCFVFGWASMDYWRNVLVKKDLCDSKNDKTWFRASHYPAEMWFVPRPGATEEDDGVVITVVYDGTVKQSYLLMLDGQTFQEINYSYLPHNVPFSFHGNWFPELY